MSTRVRTAPPASRRWSCSPQEHEHLHRLPRVPHTLCFGQTRKVDRQATVSVGDAIYSVPHRLIGERVWVRAEAEQLVVVHIDELQGPQEVARHRLTTPGAPEHQRRALSAAAGGRARAQAPGPQQRGARVPPDRRRRRAWLTRRGRGGHAADPSQDGRGGRSRQAARHRAGRTTRSERCASYGRFADGDLASILAHQQTGDRDRCSLRGRPEERSLQTLDPRLGGIRTMNTPESRRSPAEPTR